MSLLNEKLFTEQPMLDLDIFKEDYYKLPFCDENASNWERLSPPLNLWENYQVEDDVITVDDLAASLSTSSASCDAPQRKNTHPTLLNERPDTPLVAVAFEDFFADHVMCGLDSAERSSEDASPLHPADVDEVNVNDVAMMSGFICDTEIQNLPQGCLETGSERTIDCTLSSAASPSVASNNILTAILKREDGNSDKNAGPPIRDTNRRHTLSFHKNQPIVGCQPLVSSRCSPKQSEIVLCEQILTKNKSIAEPSEDNIQATLRVSPNNRDMKSTPQTQINIFNHKIPIPASSLRTILTKRRPLPPSPPSGATSDGEWSSNPRSTREPPRTIHIRIPPNSQLLNSTKRFPRGEVMLTEEEKRTLSSEGFPIPTTLPLSKSEEKSLKKVRRKIKNKISAQESRRKKKEYVETLEKRMDVFNQENLNLKRKLDTLENNKRSLLCQLRSLQTLVAGKIPTPSRTVTTQTSSYLMVLVWCFAIFLGGWYPQLHPQSSPASMTSLRDGFVNNGPSRVLFSYEEDHGRPGDGRCHGHYEQWSALEKSRDAEAATEDTYDQPSSGGGYTVNHTGEEGVIPCTVEARTTDDVIASHSVIIKSSRAHLVEGDTQYDVTRRLAATAQLVTK